MESEVVAVAVAVAMVAAARSQLIAKHPYARDRACMRACVYVFVSHYL